MTGLQWVVDGYTLMFAALLLSAGSLSRPARRSTRVRAGLVVFVLASAACGLAPSLRVLLVAAARAGLGGRGDDALVDGADRAGLPGPGPRARAVAVWAMGGAVASSAGPVLGGLLTSSAGG